MFETLAMYGYHHNGVAAMMMMMMTMRQMMALTVPVKNVASSYKTDRSISQSCTDQSLKSSQSRQSSVA